VPNNLLEANRRKETTVSEQYGSEEMPVREDEDVSMPATDEEQDDQRQEDEGDQLLDVLGLLVRRVAGLGAQEAQGACRKGQREHVRRPHVSEQKPAPRRALNLALRSDEQPPEPRQRPLKNRR
jgi:hypothetical protein